MPQASSRRPVAVLVAAALLLFAGAPAALAGGGDDAAVDRAADVVSSSVAESDSSRLLVTYRDPVDAEVAVATLADAKPTGVGERGEAGGVGDVQVAATHTAAEATSAVQILDFGEVETAAQAATWLAAHPDVVSVEPDVPIYPTWTSAGGAGEDGAEGDTLEPAWWLDNDGGEIGGVEGLRGADIGATQAWDHATGDGVVVAVIDTGVDISHPALRDRLWINPGERQDGTDTDGNGYTDDVHGWNFANGDDRIYVSASADAHGTHVAGVIVGAEHTASGAGGAAPDARIMVLRFIDGDSGTTSAAIEAIRYAVDNGADVINASWGSQQQSLALRTVLEEIDLPVVASAGNTGEALEDQPTYPAAWDLDNVVSVAAIDHTGELAPFSAYSRDKVSVAAPGVRIAGPFPDGRYALASGTSQAAPLVTGAVAMALERHPELSGVEVADAVRATVRPLSSVAQTRSGGLVRVPSLLDHLGTAVPACAEPGEVAFTDVRAGSAHHDAVACMVALGVTRGVSADSYGALDGLTRAQVTTMVARALEQAGVMPEVPSTGRFEDVPEGSTHRDAIEALADVGIVEGDTATTFDPGRTTTRVELAGVVARAAEFAAGGEVRALTADFVDLAEVSDVEGINKAAWLGIVLGQPDGRFEPEAAVRRDQAASMVTRLLDRWVQQGILDAR